MPSTRKPMPHHKVKEMVNAGKSDREIAEMLSREQPRFKGASIEEIIRRLNSKAGVIPYYLREMRKNPELAIRRIEQQQVKRRKSAKERFSDSAEREKIKKALTAEGREARKRKATGKTHSVETKTKMSRARRDYYRRLREELFRRSPRVVKTRKIASTTRHTWIIIPINSTRHDRRIIRNLRKAISLLSLQKRKLIKMHFMESKSIERIAQILRKKPDEIKKEIDRILEKLSLQIKH
ncbi:MAG: hypothetical protein Q7S21_03395 [archaeon]|nr:hypothetical protein [archaeon]